MKLFYHPITTTTYNFVLLLIATCSLHSSCATASTDEKEVSKQELRLFVDQTSFMVRNLQSSEWCQVGSDINSEAAYDQNGASLALSADGTTIVIGSPSNDANGLTNSGHVRVFNNDGSGQWNQVGNDIDGVAFNDYFGIAAAISANGTTIAIGASFHNNTGHVRVFNNDGSGQWNQVGNDIDGEAALDGFGASLDLSADGTIIAIGGPSNSANGLIGSGHVRVFNIDGSGQWQQVGNAIAGEAAYDRAGRSVALSADGSTVAIGAPYNDANGMIRSGHVRVFNNDGSGQWNQVGNDIDGEAAADFSASSLSISANGRTVAIGSVLNDDNGLGNNGHIRVFNNDGSGLWNQVGNDIDGQVNNQRFGYSVDLSADGTIIAVGDGNTATSYARVFQNDGSGQWNQVGDDIGGIDGSEFYGPSIVALSADGTTVAVGTPKSYEVSGNVKLYTLVEAPDSCVAPSSEPSTAPSGVPSSKPTGLPSVAHSARPSAAPSTAPSSSFSMRPSVVPSRIPTAEVSGVPSSSSVAPSHTPSAVPSTTPSTAPSAVPSSGPSSAPSSLPTITTPGAKGDPHFTTWHGQNYDFHGVCDLVLLQNNNFNGHKMNVHLRTKRLRFWSYIASVAIQIGYDVIEIVGGAHQNAFWFNQQRFQLVEQNDDFAFLTSLGGYPVKFKYLSNKAKMFIIELGYGQSIIIKTWNAMVSVNIKGARKNDFGSSSGLMGSFDDGLLKGRDKQTKFIDLNEFGLEWQVTKDEPMLFHNIEGPQAPTKCQIPSSAEMRRHLGELQISRSDAEIACSASTEEEFDLCVFDVIASNNVDVAGAY